MHKTYVYTCTHIHTYAYIHIYTSKLTSSFNKYKGTFVRMFEIRKYLVI